MKVSIVIPVYNVSNYIERCILSVMNQTYQDIECLIVNDCTPDDSMIKCQKLLSDYQGPIRFVILNHEKNMGQAAARNTGTEVASGEYIYYLDSDDDITSDCIASLLEIAEKDSQIEMVQGNYSTCCGEDICPHNWDGKAIHIIGNEMAKSYTHNDKGLNVYVWNKLIRLSFLKKNNIKFREGVIHEDNLWMFYVKKYLTNLWLLPSITYNYYIRSGSTMRATSMNVMGDCWALIYKEILDNLTHGKERIELQDNVGYFCSLYLAQNKNNSAYESLYDLFLNSSLKHHAWKAYLMLLATKAMNKMDIRVCTLDQIIVMRLKIISLLRSFLKCNKC